MPLKWQSLSQDSDSAQQPAVPFGSPEGHFPDQLNNCSREAMAAVAEIGSALFSGTDANGASTTTPALSDGLKQFMYDTCHPVNSMIMWDSNDGVNPIAEHVPSGVTATWTPCDGTVTTPDLRNVVLAGADIGNTLYTGDIVVAGNTATGGGHTPTGTVGGTSISIAQMPSHSHSVSDPGHFHSYTSSSGSHEGSGSGANARNTFSTNTGSKTTGISIVAAGSGQAHIHAWTGNAVSDHTHTAGLPVRTQIEIYKRTA